MRPATHSRYQTATCIFLLASLACSGAFAQKMPSRRQLEFFEKRIRPVLVEHCYECHSSDADEVKGGLRVDTKESLHLGGDSGSAITLNKPSESPLLSALRFQDFDMPPNGKLPDSVIGDFERWVAMGAPDPRTEGIKEHPAPSPTIATDLWSLQPIVLPQVPESQPDWSVAQSAKTRSAESETAIDRFLQVAREREGVEHVERADPLTLVRRLYFDLVGLPPPPELVERFSDSISPEEFEELVNSLLDSPQYGERWARHWLDVVRYGESAGSSRDVLMLYAWRYRDYVIDAFNRDLPYNQFIQEQIAGDLLPAQTKHEQAEQIIATGLLAIGSKSLNGGNLNLDIVDDQIDVIGKAILGLTVSCARCHDHKFDPIPTADYYALAGIFRNTETRYGGGTKRPKSRKDYLSAYATLPTDDERSAEAIQRLEKEFAEVTKRKTAADKRQNNLLKRLPKKWELVHSQLKEEESDQLTKKEKDELKRIEDFIDASKQLTQLTDQLNQVEKQLPKREYALAVQDRSKVQDWPIQLRGDKAKNGPVIARGFLHCASTETVPPGDQGSGRLELAQWLTDPAHPLTSRVIVNRVWQHLFGRGLVSSVDNFGVSGTQPTHPQLLDYMAHRFVHVHHWSIKSLIREIVRARTYQLASSYSEPNYDRDPDNSWLWRHSRIRLEAEPLRDAILATSGNLTLEPYRGSLVQVIGEGEVGRNIKTDCLDEPFPHRSIYLPIIRGIVPEFLKVFDLPEPSNVQGERDVTTVPAQSLYMMNSNFVLQQAELLADRLAQRDGSAAKIITELFQLTLARYPSEEEITTAAEYLDVAPGENVDFSRQATRKKMIGLCQAVFASAEFRYLD